MKFKGYKKSLSERMSISMYKFSAILLYVTGNYEQDLYIYKHYVQSENYKTNRLFKLTNFSSDIKPKIRMIMKKYKK